MRVAATRRVGFRGAPFVASLTLLLLVPQVALGFPGAGGRVTWSDGSDVRNAYGVMGTMFAYSRPATGVKVNSMYVRNPDYPNSWAVEVGYTSTGSGAGAWGLPENHDPWFFTVRYKDGVYAGEDFSYTFPFTVGERTTPSLQRRGNDDWDVYYGNYLAHTWWDMPQLLMGRPTVGEERCNTGVDPRADITWMKLKQSNGGWLYWWHGVAEGSDGAYSFRFNHVGDSNHWVYCDDHNR
ncbi:MAG: hypothetical protein WC971_05810 [Coriobacteriia bacterium]